MTTALVGLSMYPPYDSLPLKGGKRSAHGFWDRNGETDHLGGSFCTLCIQHRACKQEFNADCPPLSKQ